MSESADHPTGRYYYLVAPEASRLMALFKAGIPVTILGDGLTYRVEGPRPRDTEDTDT
ncbi:hypothetical protein [Pseudotabrizicola alkalilacus]|uniref:hypothetical protein n=1 Tax=Pseudotabrizicola alkalilacus TaxID=2305252 RepID=UPI001314E9F6|nr:hypothetical protein [Pseudotabrizicola alkalilacus]